MPREGDALDRVIETGRFFFAISVLAFGVQQFIYTGFLAGLELVPEWIPAHTFLAYLTGVALIAAGVSIVIGKRAHVAAGLLSILFLLCILLLHGPRLAAIVHEGSERTRAFETLAMCGGALMLAGILAAESRSPAWDRVMNRFILAGRFLLGISLVIFGVNHFMFASFVAALIPAWIPWHLFWAYFAGASFVAAALAIAFKKCARLAALLLGLMFFLWVVLVHAPRVAAHLRNGDEWNSAFVALAMSGVAFIAVGATMNGSRPVEGEQT